MLAASTALTVWLAREATISVSERMIEAVMTANDGELARLAAVYPVNWSNRGGEYPLNIAAYYGSPKSVEILLAAGADVNVPNRSGENALMSAVFHDNASIIEMLLAHGADVKHQDMYGQTAYHWAICYRAWHSLDILLAARPLPGLADNFGVTIADAALHFNDVASLTRLLNAGALPTRQTPFGTHGLIAAATPSPSLSLNLDPGSNHPATYPYRLSFVQELMMRAPPATALDYALRHPASLTQTNALGMDALMLAASQGRLDLLTGLAGARPAVDCERKDRAGRRLGDYPALRAPAGRALLRKMGCP
jgi:ankyrin repeat protein